METHCPICNTENPSDSKYCKECATPLPSAMDAPPSFTKTLETPVGEIKRGTLFANRYEVIKALGKGGMGKVYRAMDLEVKEEVALKLLKPEIAFLTKSLQKIDNFLTTFFLFRIKF